MEYLTASLSLVAILSLDVIYNWTGNNASVFGQFALNSSAFGNIVGNLWLVGPDSGEPYLNVGNGGPTRIDGKAADSGGTKIDLAGNWGPRAPKGSADDWIGHGVNSRVAPDGPWPDLAACAATPPPDADHDGIPDA